jgi:hypothetical protein
LLLALSLVAIALLVGAILYLTLGRRQSTTGGASLAVWEEDCGTAFPAGGSFCISPLQTVAMPDSFVLSNIVNDSGVEVDNGSATTWTGQAMTLHQRLYGMNLSAGDLVLVRMVSTAPVNLSFYFDNRSGYDVHSLSSEIACYGRLILRSAGTSSFLRELPMNQTGFYIVSLTVDQPRPIAEVTFNVEEGIPSPGTGSQTTLVCTPAMTITENSSSTTQTEVITLCHTLSSTSVVP